LISLFLYIFGFFFIAGEWFASWQSVKWNAKTAAMPFIVTLGLTYLIFTQQEKDDV
jgi:predicted small integral membrane protein